MPLRPYLELVRPANVVTALADVLAGFAVAGLVHGRALPWLLLSTACLYAGGVVLNDFFDRILDAVERPERPIPSGKVIPSAAATLGAVLLAAGVLSARQATVEAGIIAAIIAALVVVYDALTKPSLLLGPITVGACRGLNLLLGIAAVPSAIGVRWMLALFPFIYVTAIAALSRGEVHGGSRRISGFALGAISGVVAGLLFLAARSSAERQAAGLVVAFALGWQVLRPLWRAVRDPNPSLIRHAVKTGVLSLVLLDAALAAIYAGPLYGLLVLTAALLSVGLARLFAVT